MLSAEAQGSTPRSTSDPGSGSSPRPAGSLPDRSLQDEEPSSSPLDSLAQAVLLYPLAVTSLVEKLREKGACRDAEWGSLLGKAPFAGSSDGGSASLAHLIHIYVERSHLLWKVPPPSPWPLTP